MPSGMHRMVTAAEACVLVKASLQPSVSHMCFGSSTCVNLRNEQPTLKTDDDQGIKYSANNQYMPGCLPMTVLSVCYGTMVLLGTTSE